jgi:hypothetical protein
VYNFQTTTAIFRGIIPFFRKGSKYRAHPVVQGVRAFGVPEIMIMTRQHYTLVSFAYSKVNEMAGILVTNKIGSGQEDPLSSILFLIAIQPLNRLLIASFLELMYCTE